jgi:hypothetical protein
MDPSTPTRRAPATSARVDPSSPLTVFNSDVFPPSSPPQASRPDIQSIDEDGWGDIGSESEDDINTADLADDQSCTAGSIVNKLKVVFGALRAVRWDLSDFLEAFIQEKDSNGQVIIWKGGRYTKEPKHRRRIMREALDRPAIRALQGDILHIPTAKAELEQLRTTKYFGECLPEKIDFDTLDFSVACDAIQDKAPSLYASLHDLTQNHRAHRESYPSDVDRGNIVLMVVSMLSYARAKKTSNFIPSLLGMSLSTSGVKRRVVSVLHGLGICPSYKTGSRLLAGLEKRAEVCIKSIVLLRTCLNSCSPNNAFSYTLAST